MTVESSPPCLHPQAPRDCAGSTACMCDCDWCVSNHYRAIARANSS